MTGWLGVDSPCAATMVGVVELSATFPFISPFRRSPLHSAALYSVALSGNWGKMLVLDQKGDRLWENYLQKCRCDGGEGDDWEVWPVVAEQEQGCVDAVPTCPCPICRCCHGVVTSDLLASTLIFLSLHRHIHVFPPPRLQLGAKLFPALAGTWTKPFLIIQGPLRGLFTAMMIHCHPLLLSCRRDWGFN